MNRIDKYPFVATKYIGNEIDYYHSEIEDIEIFEFDSKEEVVFANAVYENMKGDFNKAAFVKKLRKAYIKI